MEIYPWTWALAALVNILLLAFAVWIVWTLVASIRGVHEELTRIRRVMEASEGRVGGAP